MKYFRLTSNSEGGSEMEVVDVAVSPVGFIPDQPALDLSEPKDSKSFTFIRTPSGWSGGWHPSPRRQYVNGIPENWNSRRRMARYAVRHQVSLSCLRIPQVRDTTHVLQQGTTGGAC